MRERHLADDWPQFTTTANDRLRPDGTLHPTATAATPKTGRATRHQGQRADMSALPAKSEVGRQQGRQYDLHSGQSLRGQHDTETGLARACALRGDARRHGRLQGALLRDVAEKPRGRDILNKAAIRLAREGGNTASTTSIQHADRHLRSAGMIRSLIESELHVPGLLGGCRSTAASLRGSHGPGREVLLGTEPEVRRQGRPPSVATKSGNTGRGRYQVSNLRVHSYVLASARTPTGSVRDDPGHDGSWAGCQGNKILRNEGGTGPGRVTSGPPPGRKCRAANRSIRCCVALALGAARCSARAARRT